jgi:hypothetical protein
LTRCHLLPLDWRDDRFEMIDSICSSSHRSGRWSNSPNFGLPQGLRRPPRYCQ